jgi:hypothetical protein
MAVARDSRPDPYFDFVNADKSLHSTDSALSGGTFPDESSPVSSGVRNVASVDLPVSEFVRGFMERNAPVLITVRKNHPYRSVVMVVSNSLLRTQGVGRQWQCWSDWRTETGINWHILADNFGEAQVQASTTNMCVTLVDYSS